MRFETLHKICRCPELCRVHFRRQPGIYKLLTKPTGLSHSAKNRVTARKRFGVNSKVTSCNLQRRAGVQDVCSNCHRVSVGSVFCTRQSTLGNIVGVVYDPSQQLVDGAIVKLKSLEDDSIRSTTV